MSKPGSKRWQQSSAQLPRGKLHDGLHGRDEMPALSNPKMRRCSSLHKQAHPALLTESEFQSLPTSVQRKYFSTLERLQILQQSSNVYTHCAPSRHRQRPRTSGTGVRPVTSTSLASSIRRRKHRNSLNLGHLNVKAETDFYLSLPDKIRRQQFSKEEQLRIQSQLVVGAPLTIPRSSQGSYPPSTTSSAKYSRRLSNSALRKDSKVPSIELPRPVTAPMNCFDGKPARVDSRRPSLLKDVSLHRPTSSVFSPKSQLSSPTLCSPSSPSFPHHQRQMSSRTATMVRPSTDSNLSIDPAATYYQDPEARKKLRKYLASPQKFDEAVEFGFPSLPARTSTCERDQPFRTISYSNSGNDAQHFLRDNRVDFLETRKSIESSDGDTISYNDSPVTPSSGEELGPRVRPYGASIFKGLDKSDLPSLRFNFDGMSEIMEVDPDHDPSSIYDPLANREMTLRMTLTRPELRATEEELYGWGAQEEKDPLALEALHLSDDMTGQNGAFAVKTTPARNRRSGVFRKFFDRVKSR